MFLSSGLLTTASFTSLISPVEAEEDMEDNTFKEMYREV
jgi:hypothetical protein